jgi:hypothetical protein
MSEIAERNRWTDRRLQRLFDHYNRTYWRRTLPEHAVRVRKLEESYSRRSTWKTGAFSPSIPLSPT